MRAVLLLKERHVLDESTFVEIVIWQVPKPVKGSAHGFKYRLALVADDVCVLRFDNETGKGDHKHLGAPGRLWFHHARRLDRRFLASRGRLEV